MSERFPWGALRFALVAWGLSQLADALFYIANALDVQTTWTRAGGCF